MHSRIFQILPYKIEKEDFMNEDHLFETDNFIGPIADYISDDNDRDEDIKDIIRDLDSDNLPFDYDAEDESIVFKKGFKKKFFLPSYVDFRNKVNLMTLEDFIERSFEYEIMLNPLFSYYVYDDNNDPKSFFNFLREAEEEKKYYFGGVLDYHF